ncbi:MAG: Bug family tripartite tricarboxylate transporter substrate binding protein [Burkholderiales bacterium]
MHSSWKAKFSAALAVASVYWIASPGVFAQSGSWPTKPVRFIVPFTPGGANDLLPRIFAERMQNLGQPVVVENRPGAGNNVGTAYVATQPSDGHTLLLASVAHVVNINFFAKLGYDPIKDFAPITMAATIPFVMTVNASLGVSTTKEMIAYIRAKPSTYATAGIGTSHHLAAELLRTMTGADLTHIPYKGAAGIVPALLASEVTFSIASMSTLVPHFKSGKLRALAVSGSERTPLLPDVPTMGESGVLPGYAIDVWFGVLAPAGTPRPIIDRLNSIINGIVRDGEVVRDKLTPVGLSPVGSTPERFGEVMRADLAKYVKITREANIKPE